MNDENSNPKDMATIVVKRYRDKVLIPNLDKDVSSDKDMIPQTIEKNISGIITSLREEINKSDTMLKKFITIKSLKDVS